MAEDNCKKYQITIEQLNKNIEELNSAMVELGQENQNLQVVQNMRNNRKWENDKDAIQCNNCSKKFTVSIRKVKLFRFLAFQRYLIFSVESSVRFPCFITWQTRTVH